VACGRRVGGAGTFDATDQLGCQWLYAATIHQSLLLLVVGMQIRLQLVTVASAITASPGLLADKVAATGYTLLMDRGTRRGRRGGR